MRKNVFIKAVALIMMLIMAFPVAACSKDQAKDIGEGIAEGVVGVLQDANGNEVNVYEGIKCTTKANENMLNDYVVYKSGNSYYFVFYGGRVFNTALDNGVKKLWQGIGESTVTFQLVETTEETLESATSKTVENTNTVENNFSAEFNYGYEVNANAGVNIKGFSAGASVKTTLEIGLGYQRKWGFSETSTISQSYRECVANTKEETTIKEFTFNKDCPKGVYYYILLGDIDVYNVVVVNAETKSTEVGTFSTIVRSEKQMIYVGEEEEYNDTPNEKLNFELSEVESIINNAIVNGQGVTDITEEIKAGLPEKIDLTRYTIKNGEHYNKSKESTSKVYKNAHIKFDLGQLYLYGCSNMGEKYIVKNQSRFSIKYNILQDLENLDFEDFKDGATWNYDEYNQLSEDSDKSIYGTNIVNEKIGKGAYWIRITYGDNMDEQDEFNGTNFMSGKSKNSYIELLSEKDIRKDVPIKQIEIVIVYELKVKVVSKWGIVKNGDVDYPNYRLETTILFI